jgi:hypothetical protein
LENRDAQGDSIEEHCGIRYGDKEGSNTLKRLDISAFEITLGDGFRAASASPAERIMNPRPVGWEI